MIASWDEALPEKESNLNTSQYNPPSQGSQFLQRGNNLSFGLYFNIYANASFSVGIQYFPVDIIYFSVTFVVINILFLQPV